ncbi:unnamed protein product [Aspergillus oryzae]|uniref:Stress-response A/B barrel domain-containing protein n=1 Tax=Aspergillus oryzae (strain 3.042) TaxID=1160506 RepID=I8TTD8_ASPO3|nr:hypothetical protein Ao3042_06110 [Aspergillus oryzae 3.042]KDE83031.1 hypothetical protein AO1008_09614 [Aspergillus oryzae 100-8]GMF81159.1 unnamed protein product [Aspergillus oryzae]GMF97034.1 unnamed protein product [Aspergillus oryzae]GMG07856.1 unnamed protein product [Aspergillus oryzae]|eukprot:EIT77615.1 hypothetical protein Ao3042_06110 [Aspergillus oryzae 3.042]
MPVYHIVLFRLKQGVTPAQLANWTKISQAMVGQIPGLRSLKTNPPLPISVPRAKGFDMGLVAVLDKKEDVAVYAAHPAHLEYVFPLPFLFSLLLDLFWGEYGCADFGWIGFIS